nr:hypothetical protein [Lachnoclostridium phocaeense]
MGISFRSSKQIAFRDAIANAVLYAVSQPDNVDVSDLAVRPSMES